MAYVSHYFSPDIYHSLTPHQQSRDRYVVIFLESFGRCSSSVNSACSVSGGEEVSGAAVKSCGFPMLLVDVNNFMLTVTDLPLLIRINDATKFDENHTGFTPACSFGFRNQIELIGLHATSRFCDTAEGVFVCFDGVMSKLHNLKASKAGQMLYGKQDFHFPDQGGCDDDGDDGIDDNPVSTKLML
ncbi:unnamed protein product [Eruca vesicaria subsp. sativa]|uniref:Uncharacterized protein n=1 Tax=Eruca vesicaria subsp. sativa TaxID=29727 RepID=A0ABC8J539_ERUVS|nr:unnamed protein product [Eruca vesicaria subsp. sativa]